MSGELPFIDVNGVEVANAYRTASYLQRGLGPLTFEVGSLGCSVLAREVGGMGPFVSPSADPAPWYSASVPESAEFLGFIPRMDFQTIDVKRSVSQRFGGIGGGVIGIEQFAARGLHVEGMLIASTCPGLEYGRHWLYSRLGGDCIGCALAVVRVRDSCPPTDGSNDTRGERIIYDAALTDGISRTDDGGYNCCEYDGIEFTLAGQSPYLYSRAGTASADVEVQTLAPDVFFPVQPATIDTFVRANTGPPPSGSWSGQITPTDGNTLRVLSNLLNNSTPAGNGSAYWNAATFGPDVAVTLLVPTRVVGGQVSLYARIFDPNTVGVSYVKMTAQYSASNPSDVVILAREDGLSTTNQTLLFRVGALASGDTYGLVCRGRLIEAWRKPSGGAWARIATMYDHYPGPLVAGSRIGVALTGTSQDASTFAGATLTNGDKYPHDVLTYPIAAVPVGVTSPIITLTTSVAATAETDTITANAVRVQVKQGIDCSITDDFSVNNIATNWYQIGAYYSITGGKLKPQATSTTPRGIIRSTDGTTGGRLPWKGGRVEATVKLGTTLTNGAWGTTFEPGPAGGFAIGGAWLVRTAGSNNNLFMLANFGPGGGGIDSVSLTPVASTTYRIITEIFPTASGYEMRGYIIDQANPSQLLTRPILGVGQGLLNPAGPLLSPAIYSTPADTTEEWDSFYAIDYTDESEYIDVSIPQGVMTLDASRRVAQFVAKGSSGAVGAAGEGSAYLGSPIDTPLGWPDVCSGTGPGCLQIWGNEVAWGNSVLSPTSQGTTYVNVAWQNRQR